MEWMCLRIEHTQMHSGMHMWLERIVEYRGSPGPNSAALCRQQVVCYGLAYGSMLYYIIGVPLSWIGSFFIRLFYIVRDAVVSSTRGQQAHGSGIV